MRLEEVDKLLWEYEVLFICARQGYYGLPGLAELLGRLVSSSIQKQVLPELPKALKLAVVHLTPVEEKNLPRSMVSDNFQPIANLPFWDKLIE